MFLFNLFFDFGQLFGCDFLVKGHVHLVLLLLKHQSLLFKLSLLFLNEHLLFHEFAFLLKRQLLSLQFLLLKHQLLLLQSDLS